MGKFAIGIEVISSKQTQSNRGKMSINSLELVQQAYRYLNEKDIASYFSLMSPDVEFYQTDELPWGGHYLGLDEIKVFYLRFFS
jgi:ketosteroid isomerase-like protein